MCGPDIPINIDKDKVLGRGGYALVLRGEMMKPVSVTWTKCSICNKQQEHYMAQNKAEYAVCDF